MTFRSANAKVRAERGGAAAARAKTDLLKAAWPREVVKVCDVLLAEPMGDTTYEALLAASAWRADRPIPAYMRPKLHPKKRGRPRVLSGNEYARRNRARRRAASRALWRLKALHPEEYRQLYQEERRNEAASNKETA